MTAFIKALFLVVVAEMGDKTQLLAMAMASKYKAKQVLIGVFIATVLNHALAVAVGSYLGNFIPMDTVKIVAAISFLIFGLWTLRGDKIDEDDEKKSSFGPIVTVAIAFFIAEMGDKTQLMTITISAESNQPLNILMGTTAGMMIADGIGIIGGAWMCKHIPEKYIKWMAGIVFIFFGTLTLYNSMPSSFITLTYIIPYFLILGLLIYLIGVKFAYHDQVSNIVQTKDDTENNDDPLSMN
ncbi:TMEM165/GDT1 family protein [Clostridium lundense]|uniref:TMEM165/GDT1 family protein n=1 Tax=Clostridium lundense TaxID=319475 RepID=UPI0004834FDA|nr:TMEM165/GDT1 family protein [Clostridium lundense]